MRLYVPLAVGLLLLDLAGCQQGVLSGAEDAGVDARDDALLADGRTDDALPADGRADVTPPEDAPRADVTPLDGAIKDTAPLDTTPLDTTPTLKPGTIVPLYTYPTHSSWSVMVTAKQAHPAVPVVAIVNASNGPGASLDPSYLTGINKLASAGVLVIGYVYTSYAARAQAAVKSDIDAWKAWYPAVGGIFFDEQSTTVGQESYYAALSSYAKGKGLTYTVGNPGTDTVASYVGTVDTILTYESAGLPTIASLQGWHAQHSKDNFGVIPYAVPALDATFVASAKQHVGYIYLTSDTLPNPWDSLPAYFGALVAELDK